jgi:O-antigen ligase
LGAVSILTPWILIGWFYLVLLTDGMSIIRKQRSSFVPIVYLIVYTTSFELLARMSETSPFIPYELGKYLLLLLLSFGILKGYRKGNIGWLMVFLLLPAALFDISGESTIRNLVFNLIGPINVALAVVFFQKQEVNKKNFVDILRLLLYPLVSVLAFTVLGSPSLEDVEFTLGANFETSGGFGSNQVSTALGLGAFLVFILWWKREGFSGYLWLDVVFLLLFVFRGLVTFSRGGMIGGALGIIIFLLLDRGITGDGRVIKPVKAILTAIPVFIILTVTFTYANKVTGGLLSKRYQGETPGTLAGRKEKTLNVFTSNRLQIFKDDLELWKENPLLGVGTGASYYLRENTHRIAAHVELSRLLSEHGLLGAFYFLILCGLGFKLLKKAHTTSSDAILFAIFVLALFTTFHSAMRTYVSPLLIGLSMLTVYEIDEVEEA